MNDVIAAVTSRMSAIDARFGQPAAPIRAGWSDAPTFESVFGQVSSTTPPSVRSGAPSAMPLGATLVDSSSALGRAAVAPAVHDHVHDHVHDPATTLGATATSLPPDVPFSELFEAAGVRHGVPPQILAAVGWVESRYQVDAVSPAGAIGMMQLMPFTARELGVDPTDPVQAVDGAARLLASHHDRFGTWDLALAAYHSGGGAVADNGNQPPPRAAEYVRRVHERLEHA